MSTMDFFGHQQRAKTASKWLVLLFVAAVLGIIACIYVAAVITFAATDISSRPWQPEVLLAVTVGVLAVVIIAMMYKTSQLSQGGGKVATMLGGRRVTPDTQDPKERMLHNVVEEMAIASGIPVPEVYLLERESGLNAFAAGWGTKDAAIAVTSGLLDQLSRDELQGVIAHEFSHVFHGDMRLNIRLMGVLFGIVCIATIGRILLYTMGRGSSSNRKGGAAGILLFGLALMIIGWLGVLFARMIQAAVSRQREFLADSSAVQYTRNPKGIGMALAKIGGLGATLKNAHADEASHMMFADGVKRFFGGALATHPPIKERIVRILPGAARELGKADSMAAAVAAAPTPEGAAGFAGGGGGLRGEAGVSADQLVKHVGDPQPEHVAAARALIEQMPLDLVSAAHDPQRAGPLAMAMLLDRDSIARHEQLQALPNRDSREIQQARMMVPALAQVSDRAVLPLLEMAIPALRSLPASERAAVRRDARALAMADETITPFEFALLKTIEKHVPAANGGGFQLAHRPTALMRHPRENAVVLSVLARIGAHDDEQAAAVAFARGLAELAIDQQLELLPPEQCTIVELERSLDQLESVSPVGKRNLLAACVAAAAADDVVSPGEADLLRALAEIWGCPIPLVASTTSA